MALYAVHHPLQRVRRDTILAHSQLQGQKHRGSALTREEAAVGFRPPKPEASVSLVSIWLSAGQETHDSADRWKHPLL
jgi:hypothetical protein